MDARTLCLTGTVGGGEYTLSETDADFFNCCSNATGNNKTTLVSTLLKDIQNGAY